MIIMDARDVPADLQEFFEPVDEDAQTDVFKINTTGYKGSHFAVFPLAIPDRIIRAATSERGVCGNCGKPWERKVEQARGFTDGKCNGCGAERSKHIIGGKNRGKNGFGLGQSKTMLDDGAVPCGAGKTTGWEPGCSCDAEVVPATVLDPFMGSGTTALAARKLGRKSIGFDLDESSAEHVANRLGHQEVLC